MPIHQVPYVNFHELNLDWILKEVQTLREEVQEVEEWREELTEEFIKVQQEVIKINATIEEFRAEQIAFEEKINTQFEEQAQRINDEFNALVQEIDEKFTDLREDIDTQFNSLSTEVRARLNIFNNQLADMEARLQAAIDNLTNDFKVLNPLTGTYDTVQNTFNSFADLHMTDALTALEYDNLELTAQTYDGKQLNAYDYDFKGKVLLP